MKKWIMIFVAVAFCFGVFAQDYDSLIDEKQALLQNVERLIQKTAEKDLRLKVEREKILAQIDLLTQLKTIEEEKAKTQSEEIEKENKTDK